MKAYHHILLDTACIRKTAVTTLFGLFEYFFMCFGCSTKFPKSEVLTDLKCFVYIDDVSAASKKEETHVKDLERVFQQLNSCGFVLND